MVAKYRDEYVSVYVFVCLSVCEDIFRTTRMIFTKFLCMLPMVVAQSSSGVVAICYILPVLWMTSCFSIIGHIAVCILLQRTDFAEICLRKVRQNSISYY